MQNALFNCLLSAIVAVASSIGTVWYLSSQNPEANDPDAASAVVKTRTLEADSIVVKKELLLVDPETNTPTIELSSGALYVQKDVYADRIGAYRVLAQKLQTTPDDPLDMKSGVFGELSYTEDGGASFALKSPRESHSITIGFDKSEKGCILSKNNDDQAIAAQAVFLRPSASDAVSTPTAASSNYPPADDAEEAEEETPFPTTEVAAVDDDTVAK